MFPNCLPEVFRNVFRNHSRRFPKVRAPMRGAFFPDLGRFRVAFRTGPTFPDPPPDQPTKPPSPAPPNPRTALTMPKSPSGIVVILRFCIAEILTMRTIKIQRFQIWRPGLGPLPPTLPKCIHWTPLPLPSMSTTAAVASSAVSITAVTCHSSSPPPQPPLSFL